MKLSFEKKSQEERWKKFDRLTETGRSDDIEEAVKVSERIREEEKKESEKKD